jgi:RNA polymerase sigma factor (sigma-70 family)
LESQTSGPIKKLIFLLIQRNIFMFSLCYPRFPGCLYGRVAEQRKSAYTENCRVNGKAGHSTMPCEANIGGRNCNWCQTDRLIGDCSDLKTVVEGYCPQLEITSWFGLCQHLGGDCDACHNRILGRCREAAACVIPSGRECSPEDVSQTLFLRLLRSPWQPEKAPLGGWLSLIIKRILLDATKGAYAAHTTPMSDWAEADPEAFVAPDPEGAPGDLADQADLRRELVSALNHLPFEARQIITLRYVEGHTLQVISNKLNIPLATLVRRLQKALDVLRRALVQCDRRA